VYAVGGRDRFVTNGGQDRIFGADKGDTVLAGDGNDWVSLDLRFGDGETDPAEDIDVTLSALQDEAAVFYEGTEGETHLQGVEQMYLYTGAGNDRFDTRGVASNSGWFGYSNYISLGDGDDHYLTDLGALGSANFLAGDGIDTLTIDWGDATSGITYYSNSSTTYYRVYVDDFGYVYQYFSDIEKIDFTTGSASDMVYAVGGRDRFVTNGGQDRIFGADKGDTVLAGDGNDWVSLDLRFGDGETDPAEDIDVTLSALQDEAAVFYEGTEDETHLQGVEQMYLYTGAGDDRFDTRGVASNSGWFGYSNYISLGDGDDHYLTDLGALGSANFLAGDGFDTLTIDWGAATSGITYYSNSSTTYYRVYVEGFGYVYQYFSNVEIFDLTGGSGADSLLGGSLTDRLIGNAGNDTLRAGSGNDFVQGGAGHDLIVLGDGDDTAFGEAGNDTIIGSLGSDVNVAAYSGSAASIYVIDLGEGSYRVITEAGGSDLLQNIQTLRFTDGLVTTDYAISSLVNSAPVLPATAEATLVTGQTTPIFDAEATDPESHPVTYSLAGADAGLFAIDPLTGEVTFDGDPTLALPEAAVGGLVYSLEIIASDGYASGSQELTVTGVSNLPPEAVDDLATTNQSAPVSVDVLANDFDLEGPAPTLAGFGQPEHGSVTQAGGSLVYQPDAGFYGVDQFVYDIVDAQGLRSSGEVVINVNRVRERLDSEELASWQSQTTVISPTGQLISKEITYDDGRVLVAQYTNGVRSSQTLTDPENAHSWTSQSLAYDGGGALISMDTTFDDGRVLSAQYTNGVRSAQTLTDPENAFSWTDQIYAYDSDGTLISRVANYDDGRVLVSEYTAGVRSAQTLTDPQNAHSWTSQSSAYGVDGVLMSRVTNHDDGRVQSATYTAGVRSTQTLTDPDNAHRWTDQSLTYDSEGNLISKVTNFDDGRVGNFRYVAGVQAEATITDAADAFVWASIERDYNSSGVLIESQTTYDDGRILTTEFAAGVRSTQTQTDPDNVYLWTNKTDVFDVDGTLISRVTNFDDGTVQTWPVVDDSPA
ncbi:Ig-like domain-containing protein, partial [Pelagimonas varians]|uniref:Ig-like domain-containing protein n=1 Tax=Pelagimonas varians TaxID=696760 RepID=UPI0015970C0D